MSFTKALPSPWLYHVDKIDNNVDATNVERILSPQSIVSNDKYLLLLMLLLLLLLLLVSFRHGFRLKSFQGDSHYYYPLHSIQSLPIDFFGLAKSSSIPLLPRRWHYHHHCVTTKPTHQDNRIELNWTERNGTEQNETEKTRNKNVYKRAGIQVRPD